MKRMDTILHDIAKSTISLYMLNGYTKAELMGDRIQQDITNEVTRYADERHDDKWRELNRWIEMYILDM